MKKDLVLLAELLATDDKFNAKFFSAATEEQMYELAKTKFSDFTRDDFSEFMQKLQEASDLCGQKLSPEELAEISGGAGGIGKKIASLMLTLTAGFGMVGTAPVKTDAISNVLSLLGLIAESEGIGDTTLIHEISDRHMQLIDVHNFCQEKGFMVLKS